MAQKLMEQWGLAVLRAELDVSRRESAVALDLIVYEEKRPRLLWSDRFGLDAFGVPERARPERLRVPDAVSEQIAGHVRAELGTRACLWLRLVRPCGYLSAVPWEAALVPASGLPMLRVPDRLPVAADPGLVWTTAIAVSAPRGSTWAPPYVEGLLGSLAVDFPVPLDVHVFADRDTAAGLRARDVEARPWVHLHEPADAVTASSDRMARGVLGRSAGSVWGDWIATGLAGRAVRAVHVVLDAAWDDDRPILALSPDPNTPVDATACQFVSGDDLAALTDAQGAATLSVGSPPDNPAEAASRMVADSLGQRRAGPTLFSSLRDDPDGRALADAYAFLAARPGGRDVPRHRSLFAYLQPEHVPTDLRETWPKPPPSARPPAFAPETGDPLPATVLPGGYEAPANADLDTFYATSEVVPTWVASSERYVSSELANLSRPAGAPEHPGSIQRDYEEGAAEALSEMQEIVARHARLT